MSGAVSDLEDKAAARAAYDRRLRIVKDRLRADALHWAREFVPKGKKSGNRWQGRSPFRDGDNPTAFSMRISGPQAGAWIDFAGGEKGDCLNLIMAVKGLSFKEAVQWVEDHYGLRTLSDDKRRELDRMAVKRQQVADASEAEARAQKIRRACHIFGEASPDLKGTPVEAYLRHRGIAVRDLRHRETRWLRVIPRMGHWFTPGRPEYPVMVAGMVNAQGVMQACHFTWLRPDGKGKAPVERAKLVWPECKGLVIRLTQGASGLSPEEAAAQGVAGPLFLTEGIEDGLSLAMGDDGQRIWAAYSLSNLANVPDHPCASSYILAQDNDWGKPQAAAQFAGAMKRLMGFHKPVTKINSQIGKDFNDQLLEKE